MLVAFSLVAVLLGANGQKPPPASASASASASTERTVTKASVFLVKTPSFLAPRAHKSPIFRGQKVKVEGEPTGSWFLVSYKPKSGAKVTGYIHASYVTDRAVAFKVDAKEIEGRSTVSGSYNLAVPGFKPEAVERRSKKKGSASRAGYAVMSKYMPLRDSNDVLAKLAVPPEPTALSAFVSEGQLRSPDAEQEAVAEAKPEEPPVGATTPTPAAAAQPASAPAPAKPAAVPAAGGAASDPSEWNTLPTSGPPSEPSEWSGP